MAADLPKGEGCSGLKKNIAMKGGWGLPVAFETGPFIKGFPRHAGQIIEEEQYWPDISAHHADYAVERI
jgi:hypothetical protein